MPEPHPHDPAAPESLADRATRRAEELLRRLSAPDGGPAGGPGAPGGPLGGHGPRPPHDLPGPPPLPEPPNLGELWGHLRSAPSLLGEKIVALRLLALLTIPACVIVWLTTGAGEFWPIWVIFGFACAFGFDAAVARGLQEKQPAARGFSLHLWLTVYTVAVIVAVWLLSGTGDFWPAWPVFTLAFLLLAHALTTPVDPFSREQDEQLVARVDELTRTRSGVLDVQAAELRRIERDLHDGAQARLVALSMQLGRAEARLGDDVDPQLLALIKGAQEDARQAIAELRDLARGIAPPLLVDRGLVAAVEALAQRSPLEVTVTTRGLDERLPTVVETAAYFVAAESITNATKHAGATAKVLVDLTVDAPWLRLTISDDGPGGADPAGSGLMGLRGRVEALDGRLEVSSVAGEGTTITAELPCGS